MKNKHKKINAENFDKNLILNLTTFLKIATFFMDATMQRRNRILERDFIPYSPPVRPELSNIPSVLLFPAQKYKMYKMLAMYDQHYI